MSESSIVTELQELLADSGLTVSLAPAAITVPTTFDATYNAALLATAATVFGKRRPREGRTWAEANYHVLKCAHFAASRPAVVARFLEWNRKRAKPGHWELLAWSDLPRGFMTHELFDATISYLELLGEAKRAKKDVRVALKGGPVGQLLEAIEQQKLFHSERELLLQLRATGLTQSKLGVR